MDGDPSGCKKLSHSHIWGSKPNTSPQVMNQVLEGAKEAPPSQQALPLSEPGKQLCPAHRAALLPSSLRSYLEFALLHSPFIPLQGNITPLFVVGCGFFPTINIRVLLERKKEENNTRHQPL